MQRTKVNGEKVICQLKINYIKPFDHGSTCNVSCTTPNGREVAFVIENTSGLFPGQLLWAIGTNTHISAMACEYKLAPFWAGED